VAPGGELGHVDPGLGDGVLGGAPAPAGHGFCLLELFLIRGQQLLDHLGQPGDLGLDPVDALQHGLEHGSVLGGDELHAVQRVLQLGDLAAGPGAGQLGQDLGVAFPGDQVVHDVPVGDPVQVGDDRGELDQHEPFPAVVLDRGWQVQRANNGAQRLSAHTAPKCRNRSDLQVSASHSGGSVVLVDHAAEYLPALYRCL
jgi:hypothetical protein